MADLILTPWLEQPKGRNKPRPEWARVFSFGSGDTIDQCGSGAQLSPRPSAGLVGGISGQALQFGTSDVSTTTGEIVPGISAGVTAVMIVEFLATTGANNFLFAESAASVGTYNYGFYEDSSGFLRVFVHNGTTGVVTAQAIQASALRGPQIWVLTYGNGDNNVRYYQNGAPVSGTAAQTGTIQRSSSAHLSVQRWNTAGASMKLYAAAVMPRRMAADEVSEKFTDLPRAWDALFEPRRLFVPGAASAGGAQTIAIGQATETDTAQALTAVPGARTVAISQATETDTAQALTVSLARTVAIGQATESDSAQALTAALSRALAIGQATETGTAQALTAALSRAVAIGQATETDSAQSMTVVVAGATATGQAQETDTAQSLTAVPGALSVTIGQATESDAAQALTVSVGTTVGIGLALEIDTAGAFTPVVGALTVGIGQAAESDIAQPFTVSQPGTSLESVGLRSLVTQLVALRSTPRLTASGSSPIDTSVSGSSVIGD